MIPSNPNFPSTKPLALAIAFLASCVSTPCAIARWATPEDASFARLSDEIEIDVAKDGSYVLRREFEDEVRKEPARQDAGIFQTVYNSKVETVKILEAATITKGTTYPVRPEFIQDKPLASSYQGFDQMNQIMVAFPNVDIGSRVRIKLEDKYTRAPIPGFYSDTIIFGLQRIDSKKSIRIRSELPLYFEANDPENHLEIKPGREGEKYVLAVKLRRPVYKRVMDEHGISVDSQNYPWIDIATEKDWGGMAAPLVPAYAAVLSAKLPYAFQKIAKAASAENGTVAKINAVTSLLAETMHYLGDWRAIDGGHVPRALALIAETKFGDCKDFSAATTAILRQLGLDANVAFIRRGVNPQLSPTSIPTVSAFNHAIVRVKDGAKEYWIDPTNQNSFAQGVFEDIIDRPSLVLDDRGARPFLARVPAGKPDESFAAFDVRIEVPEAAKLEVTGRARYAGRSSLHFTGAELNSSRKSIDYHLISNVGDVNRMARWSVGKYDLKSRINSDFGFDYNFTERDSEFRTTAGSAIQIPSTWLAQALLVKTEDRVSDLYLGQPIEFERKIHLHGVAPVGEADLSCAIDSPWIAMKRAYAKVKDGIDIRDTLTLKTSRLKAAEIRGKEFAKLQSAIRNCYDGTAVVYRASK